MEAGKEFHCFLSHTWQADSENRNTHTRVSRFNDYCKERGLLTWFDADQMEGHVVSQMCNGIDKSACFVVFITLKYIEKSWICWAVRLFKGVVEGVALVLGAFGTDNLGGPAILTI
eukprot:Pompholyxophrys_punicea_v1_NODE_1192_length_876_cov_1.528624.p2 type:complete len:116 gc:universal NODE_1192_length_876_cov_1.528624:350-697(+)